ncbi:MAG TPA: hypothetical protein VIV12_00825, partial [Streptosporangiaceae bacterium]
MAEQMPPLIGTLLHDWLRDSVRKRGTTFITELNLAPFMPKGWGGTADWLFWHEERQGWFLIDVKSIMGFAMKYVLGEGPKTEHVAQVSAYWHAAKKMGLRLLPEVGVFYLPKERYEPAFMTFKPTPAAALHADMRFRTRAVAKYRRSL